MKRLETLLDEGVRTGVFPLACAEVHHRGRAFTFGTGNPATVFDVASLTKVMVTTALCLELSRTGTLDLEAPLNRFFPGSPLQASLVDLLLHRSGLPAFIPFFADELRDDTLFRPACTGADRAAARQRVLQRALACPPLGRPGQQAVYSDVGFIQLCAVLEQLTGRALDALFTATIARPLGLGCGFRPLSASLPLPRSLADTGVTRPREPAPGQEGLWRVPARPTNRGEVDDDNAWVMDGVSGHAGLFASASDVARFGQAVLESAHHGGFLAPPAAWHADATTSGSTRALGFDTPSPQGSSCGDRFGRSGPRGAIGHTGFTGTSLWIDLDRALVVVLLTNRVALGRANVKIREFRPRFHDAVLDALAL